DKDRLIVQLLKADPTKSNRQVAKLTDTSHPHVAKATPTCTFRTWCRASGRLAAPLLRSATSRTNTTDPSMTRFGSSPALALPAPAELRQKVRRRPTTSGTCGRSRSLDLSGSPTRRSGVTST